MPIQLTSNPTSEFVRAPPAPDASGERCLKVDVWWAAVYTLARPFDDDFRSHYPNHRFASGPFARHDRLSADLT